MISVSQTAQPSLATLVDALERLLRIQLEGHQKLLACIERKSQAIRAANLADIATISAEERGIVSRLTECEKRRLELGGLITRAIAPSAGLPLTIAEISPHVSEPERIRLVALAAQLREALGEVKKQSTIMRHACETLSRHMTGIVQTVHSALSRARVYGQRGTIALGVPVQSVVDLKS